MAAKTKTATARKAAPAKRTTRKAVVQKEAAKPAAKKNKTSTLDRFLAIMAKEPNKTHRIADLIEATGAKKGTGYSVIYAESHKPNARVSQVEKGTFKLTAKGKS